MISLCIIVYNILGTELHSSPGEIATAKLNASKSSLISFLSSYGIQMNIVTQDKVIGNSFMFACITN